MKGKFSSIWKVTLALVLVCSLALTVAAPVAAAPDVENVTVTVVPSGVGSPATYTIEFTPNVGLYPPGNVIIVNFPPETTVPGTISTGDVTVKDLTDTDTGSPNQVDVSGNTVTVYLPSWGGGQGIDYRHRGQVIFSSACGIINPTVAGQYCLTVNTDEEPNPVPGCYYITTGPVTLELKHVAECGYIEYIFESNFETIQDALDHANYLFWDYYPWYGWYGYVEIPEPCNYIGARITVQPGTYYETIVMDTPFVELVSAGGSDVTIIDATGLVPPNVPGAVGITAGGVTFEGFTVMNAGVGATPGYYFDKDSDGVDDINGIHVLLWSDKNYVPIHYADEQEIPDTYAYHARINILDNEIHDSTGMGIAVFGNYQEQGACVLVSGNNVHDNQFDGFWGSWLRNGVEVIDPTAFTPNPEQPYACTEINDNTFADNGEGRHELDGYVASSSDNGIQIMSAYFCDWIEWGVVDKTIYIVGNDIYGNSNAGIYLGHDIDDSVIIKFNQIEYNGVFGISSHHNWPIIVSCIYNDIVGNEVWGIKNWEPVYDYPELDFDDNIIAPFNYWGDISGPSCGPEPIPHELDQRSDALGTGDAVSHYVFYRWWLTESFKIVQTQITRYYGSDYYDEGLINQQTPIVPLEQGWNTMSTPVALHEDADTMGEIVGLGGWMQNYIGGYYYDPVGGWMLLGADYQLVPLEAVYVKMAAPDMLPILLRTTDWMPARDLEPGWNLVGPNFGFWSQEIWDKPVDETLSSINGSWGVAISPSLPGQQDAWVCTPSDAGDYNMYVGDGYWVFVTEPTTLAGFRMAPWYFEDWEIDIMNCELPPWWDCVPLPPWWY
jgi:hypothetical protein